MYLGCHICHQHQKSQRSESPIMVALMPASVIAQIVGHFHTDAPRQLSAHAARQTQLQNLFNHTLADTADLHDAVTRIDPIMDAMRINNDLEG